MFQVNFIGFSSESGRGSASSSSAWLNLPTTTFPSGKFQTPVPFGLFFLNSPSQYIPFGKIHFPFIKLPFSQVPHNLNLEE